jgi:hypothetical protein
MRRGATKTPADLVRGPRENGGNYDRSMTSRKQCGSGLEKVEFKVEVIGSEPIRAAAGNQNDQHDDRGRDAAVCMVFLRDRTCYTRRRNSPFLTRRSGLSQR